MEFVFMSAVLCYKIKPHGVPADTATILSILSFNYITNFVTNMLQKQKIIEIFPKNMSLFFSRLPLPYK